MRLLILGASGGCGAWLVRLAHERGHDVRALVRPGSVWQAPSGPDVIRGDVLAPGLLEAALEGRDAVLSALGLRRRSPNPWSALASPPDLTARVTRRLVEAMGRRDVTRLVAISAAGVADSIRKVNPILRWVLLEHSTVAASYRDLAAMEAVLRQSPIDWMTVRPTTLRNGPPTGAARRIDYYGLFSKVSRSDVASWMLDAVEQPGPFKERTPMIG